MTDISHAAPESARAPLRYVHSALTAFRSAITDREVLLNLDESRFVTAPRVPKGALRAARTDWAAASTRAARACWVSVVRSQAARRGPPQEVERAVDAVHAAAAVPPFAYGQAGVTDAVSICVERCLSAAGAEDFAAAVNELLSFLDSLVGQWTRMEREQMVRDRSREEAGAVKRKRPGQAARIAEFLVILWKHDLVTFPAGPLFTPGVIDRNALPDPDPIFYGSRAPALAEIRQHMREEPRFVTLLFLVGRGVTELGDIDFGMLKACLRHLPTHIPTTWAVKAANRKLVAVHRAQTLLYHDDPTRRGRIPANYTQLTKRSFAERSDSEFKWAVARGGERLDRWAQYANAYVTAKTGSINLNTHIQTMNSLLDWVIVETGLPADPVAFCHRSAPAPSQEFVKYLGQTEASTVGDNATKRAPRTIGRHVRGAAAFFRWLLVEELTDEDGVLVHGYRNPIDADEAPAESPAGQTARQAIPVRILRLLCRILEEPYDPITGEPQYAWPRTVDGDYFDWFNPETKSWERTWSPVRALAYRLRLLLPVRELQVRLLDSGEGDATVLRPEHADATNGGWVPNSGPLASGRGDQRRPQGLVQRMWDAEKGRWYNGIWITTNKTADHATAGSSAGYPIPWENEDVIGLFTFLRDWQEKHNPCLALMSRGELSDPKLQSSEDVKENAAKLAFLFRDAASRTAPMEPVSTGRLNEFWHRLMEALEDRMWAEGLTNEDGSRIQIVLNWQEYKGERRRPTKSIFDPHSLRVAGLTALAEAGVPIHILSEMVAGHASILMTIYYVRPSAGTVQDVLDAAQARLLDIEARNWAAWLSNQPAEVLHELAVFNDAVALEQAGEVQSGLWASVDYGFCPNGGTKCDSGGPDLGGKNSLKRVYGPVEGGARNCPLCRFFITGPAFLVALVAKFNEKGGEMSEQLLTVRAKEQRRRELHEALTARFGAVIPDVEQKPLLRADEAVQKERARLQAIWNTWMALYRLKDRCLELMAAQRAKAAQPSGAGEQTGAATGRNLLVLNGRLEDVQVSVKSASQFTLMDRICKDSVFFESIDAKLPAMRRGRLLDAFLAREGRPAVFATLSDEQLVSVANAVTSWMRTSVGDADTDALVYGQQTLSALGIEREFSAMLEGAVADASGVTAALSPHGRLEPGARLLVAASTN